MINIKWINLTKVHFLLERMPMHSVTKKIFRMNKLIIYRFKISLNFKINKKITTILLQTLQIKILKILIIINHHLLKINMKK